MKARTQDEHRAINAREYPGTRQICERCQQPTERCGEDQFTDFAGLVVCGKCYEVWDDWMTWFEGVCPTCYEEARDHCSVANPEVEIYENNETRPWLYSVATVSQGTRNDLWLDSFASRSDSEDFCKRMHLLVVETEEE